MGKTECLTCGGGTGQAKPCDCAARKVRAEGQKSPAKIPDVGTREYKGEVRDGAMTLRQQFIRNKFEAPCDNIRRLLTDIEFEGDFNDATTAATIGRKLDLIARHIGLLRALRNGATLSDVSDAYAALQGEVDADRGSAGRRGD